MRHKALVTQRIWMVVVWMGMLGCVACGPKAHFLLLPNEDGTVGKILVQNEGGSQIVDRAHHETHVEAPDKAPSEPRIMPPEEIQKTFGDVLKISVRPPDHFLLYFQEGKSDLTEESKDIVPKIFQAIRDRASHDISIVGHADTKGSAEVNFRISKQRAEIVAEMLKSAGVDPENLEITSHGERNLLVQTPDEVSEPRNRRVEVTVR